MNSSSGLRAFVADSLIAALAFVAVSTVAASMAAAGSQQAPTRSVWTGAYTGEQAKRGEPLYGESCGNCHGTSLEGGEMAPPLAGGQFNANWNGLTMGDLFERL